MPIYTYTIDGPTERKDSFTGSGRNQSHNYTLVTDDPDMDEFLASAKFSDVTGIVKGVAHPSCDYSYCQTVDSEEESKSKPPQKLFRIRVTYSTAPDTGAGGGVAGGSFAPVSGPAAPQVAGQQMGLPPAERVDNPLLRPWDWSSECDTVEIALYCDRNKKMFTNTLGDPMLPPMKIQAPVVKYSLGKNFLFPKENHYASVGAVNNQAIALPGSSIVWGVETLKLVHLGISRIYENGLSYYRHNYSIKSGPYWSWDFAEYLGWVRDVPNMGRRAKVGTGGSAKVGVILDDYGQPVSEPRFLDHNSYELGYVSGDDIHWIRFHPEFLFFMNGIFV
jgi:hypothetical protein